MTGIPPSSNENSIKSDLLFDKKDPAFKKDRVFSIPYIIQRFFLIIA